MTVTIALYGEPGAAFCDRQLAFSRSAPAFETGRRGTEGSNPAFSTGESASAHQSGVIPFPPLSSTGSPNFLETRSISASTLERNSLRTGEAFALL
jgi:hypothetical protein